MPTGVFALSMGCFSDDNYVVSMAMFSLTPLAMTSFSTNLLLVREILGVFLPALLVSTPEGPWLDLSKSTYFRFFDDLPALISAAAAVEVVSTPATKARVALAVPRRGVIY